MPLITLSGAQTGQQPFTSGIGIRASLARKQLHCTASFGLPPQEALPLVATGHKIVFGKGATDFPVCCLALFEISTEPQHFLSPASNICLGMHFKRASDGAASTRACDADDRSCSCPV